MKTKLISIVILAVLGFSFKYDKPAYILYNNEGKAVKYESMMQELLGADMVFFGEYHTDPISHWLEFEITKDLYAGKKDKLVIGAEMFESDNQVILDEYLRGFFADKKFEADARLWGNYKTDYKAIVEFAKDSGIYFVASNIPRRYASIVYNMGFEGLDSLSDDAKKFIAPLPITYDPEVACYKNMLSFMDIKSTTATTDSMKPKHEMKHSAQDTASMNDSLNVSAHSDTAKHAMPAMKDKDTMKSKVMDSHMTENLPKAQAAKDATMAHFIMQNWEKGKLFIHYNGAYHSENHEGIIWYIMQADNSLNVKTIAVVYQDNINDLEEENLNKADYIVCVSSTMTQSKR